MDERAIARKREIEAAVADVRQIERRDGQPRSATVTAIEPSWAMRMRVQDIDALSESCRARFNEAFLAIMAARLAMLGGRLVAM